MDVVQQQLYPMTGGLVEIQQVVQEQEGQEQEREKK